MIQGEGGVASAFEADVSREAECIAMVDACKEAYGRIDILHNNVGIAAGDAGPTHLKEENWQRIFDVNLTSVFLTCKHTLPLMREQGGGVIINISSIAAVCAVGMVAYKTSKAGVNALTHSLALGNARYGIRVNAIMPGLMNTPMAIEQVSELRGVERDQLILERDAQVPLGAKMGTAWDIAYAALFLASEEAKFITAVVLPVDGGQSARIG
jgi:NAD(P)-dependent dehydrogenase (short-subunit alcohol dehydrogenase family)